MMNDEFVTQFTYKYLSKSKSKFHYGHILKMYSIFTRRINLPPQKNHKPLKINCLQENL
jgi:hypothetical protein